MAGTPVAGRPGRNGAGAAQRWPAGLIALTLLFSALTLTLGYLNKQRCVGPQFTATGQSEPDLGLRITRDVCYSDLQFIWSGRQIYLHRFPYLHGAYDPVERQISGGTLEYPVLTGLVIHLTGLLSHNDAEFLAWNALLLGICGLLIAFLLVRMAGMRSWWYALGPPVVFYACLNWDLLAVAAVLGAFALLYRLGESRRPAVRLICCAVLLGIGGGLKFYPLMFAAPIALWVGAGLRDGVKAGDPDLEADGERGAQPGRRSVLGGPSRADVRWAWAAVVLLVTALVFLAVNLPFMIGGFRGWWASFQFQWSRPIDVTTNSIWFWGSRPDGSPDNLALQSKLGRISTIATAAGLALALLAGAWRAHRLGRYPWMQVAAAMLAAYLLLNKVHSPQYVLWLLPFFVLLRIRAGWIIAYFVADAAMGIGFFRWQYLLFSGKPNGMYDSLAAQVVMIGVWGRATLLVGLFVAFLLAEQTPHPVWPRAGERSAARATRSAESARSIPAAFPGRVAGEVGQRPRLGHEAVDGDDQPDPVEQFRPV